MSSGGIDVVVVVVVVTTVVWVAESFATVANFPTGGETNPRLSWTGMVWWSASIVCEWSVSGEGGARVTELES
jgi:hypothetical protein